MRLALVIAPSDSRSGDAGLRREALAWLRGRLARFGFHVVIVGGAHDPEADVQRAIEKVSTADTVLVHVSGRLADRNAIAFGDAGTVAFQALTDALAARSPAHVSFVLELLHEEGEIDAVGASEILGAAVRSLGPKHHGFPVLAVLRPLATEVDRLAFTRLTLPVADEDVGPPPTESLVASMHDGASVSEESRAVAQSVIFSRGGAEGLEAPPLPFGEAASSGAADPSPSAPSIHSLIAEATETRDWARALELRRHRLHVLASAHQKSKELVAIARILQAELGDAEGAVEALEMARAMTPKPVGVLQALRRGYEKLGRWRNALEVTSALAGLVDSPSDRAELHIACARMALQWMADRDAAVASLERALSADPRNEEAAIGLRQLRQEPSVAGKRAQWDASAREAMADGLFADGADEDALTELDAVAAAEPTRISVYEKTFAAHRRAGRTDAALLAAMALEELDAAGVDEQMLIDQFRSVGPTRVRCSLDDGAWADLRAPGCDDVLTALFAAVENAAIAVRLDELREQRKLQPLDPGDRLSETSTASIVRSFHWAARVLSIDCPSLYLRDDVPDGIAAMFAREPSVALGPSVVSGLSAKDLAFLAGRHLTYYRPGHQVLLYYSSCDELTTLLLASAQVAMPLAAAQSDDPAVRALHARLARHLEPEQRAALDEAIRALDARGGQAALGAWMASVELTAARVGLVLSGDLATAAAQVLRESRDLGNVPTPMRRADLVSFCASRAHAAMRLRFAMTAPESVRPAPGSQSSLQIAS